MSRVSAAAESKANTTAPLANDLGLKKTRFSCHMLCVQASSKAAACSLFSSQYQQGAVKALPATTLQLDSPVQSQLLLEAFGHSFEAKLLNPTLHELFPARECLLV